MQQSYRKVYIHPELLDYLERICMATRRQREVRVGVSVRGALALMRAVQAYACLNDREYVGAGGCENTWRYRYLRIGW